MPLFIYFLINRIRQVLGVLNYMGTARRPRRNQPTPSLNPSPAGSAIRPRAARRRLVLSFVALPFGILFSHGFRHAFLLLFKKILAMFGSHVGSILALVGFNFAYIFRTLCSTAFIKDFLRFLEV